MGMVSGLGGRPWGVERKESEGFAFGTPSYYAIAYTVFPRGGSSVFSLMSFPQIVADPHLGVALKIFVTKGDWDHPSYKQGCQTKGNVRLWPCCDS